ncbi:MAG: hypothetical protein ACYDAC_06220 [Candidatus Dormibacteria bacterium]
MNNRSLVDPPFAANPPVKLNINAKTLGLILAILGAIGLLFGLIGLIGIFGFCGSYSYLTGCGFPVLWFLGEIVGLAGLAIGTLGAYRMYECNPQGKELVVYGLIVGFVGAVITLTGNIAAYSLVAGYGAGVAIVGLVIDAIIYFILYYLVVISRFPGSAPSAAPGPPPSWGGPSTPPPPPSAPPY